MKGETVDVVECFSLLHESFSHFLSALQQNRAQSRRLLYLFYGIKNPLNSPRFFLISKTKFISIANESEVIVFYTLIKDA